MSLLDHVIRNILNASIDDVTVVLKPEYEKLGSEFIEKTTIAYQNIPIGSADTVKCALKNSANRALEGWTYILYADIPLISPETLLAWADIDEICEKTAVVVLAMDSRNSNALGKLVPAETAGAIKGIIEAKDATKFDNTIPLCNAGLLVRKDVLQKFIGEIKPSPITGEYYITEIVRLAYEAGYVCRYHEADVSELSGVNTRQELSVLERYFQDKMREKHMNNGVTLVAPETVFFSFDTIIENDVVIDPFVVFGRNVHIKSGAHINSFCVVEGSNIENAAIGPFARLRPGTHIREKAKIGNFVEIKNSTIHEKVKINHLSYIGDSEIGKNTNVGAGTITCNYDGFNKHWTNIGENVFIGSNSAIVAPVWICDNAMVAAGSVITKDVDSGDLAISRVPQKNIKNGSLKFMENRSRKDKQ
ncbi:bifunctional protein GlmU [Alphaproteobacteria bacterium]|nr:bifunctional protein GlmU [Alphaproteobacteria bacterium]GHT90316.1 bifunctional protein GlmU [Alphaproteobacteria bacterium]